MKILKSAFITSFSFAIALSAFAPLRSFADVDCGDATLKASYDSLVSHEKKLVTRQGRGIQAIKEMRVVETGQHPYPEILAKIAPADASLKNRISKGITVAPATVDLDALGCKSSGTGDTADQLVSNGYCVRKAALQSINAGHAERKAINRNDIPNAYVQTIDSFEKERIATESFVQLYKTSCEKVAALRKTSRRQVASLR